MTFWTRIHTRAKIILIFLFMLFSINATAQDTVDSKKHNLFTNPFKPVLGIVNLGYEKNINNHLSIRTFSEYLIPDKLWLRDEEHPKLILTIGGTYYMSGYNS